MTPIAHRPSCLCSGSPRLGSNISPLPALHPCLLLLLSLSSTQLGGAASRCSSAWRRGKRSAIEIVQGHGRRTASGEQGTAHGTRRTRRAAGGRGCTGRAIQRRRAMLNSEEETPKGGWTCPSRGLWASKLRLIQISLLKRAINWTPGSRFSGAGFGLPSAPRASGRVPPPMLARPST